MTVVAAVLAGAVLVAAPTSVPTVALDVAMAGPLDDWVAADAGIPIELADGSLLVLFGDTLRGANDGDTVPAAWSFHHSSALHFDGGDVTPMYDLLPPGPDDGFYWVSDAHLRADGSLEVLAGEMRLTGDDQWGFDGFDHDLFVVTDPSNEMSWRLADKVEDGWWGDSEHVGFVGDDLYVTREDGSTRSLLHDDTTAAPVDVGLDSDGPVIPVEYDGEWWAATLCFYCGEVTLWSAPAPTGPWSWQREWTPEHPEGGFSYLPRTVVLDGGLWVYWSNNVASGEDPVDVEWVRPTYQRVIV